MRKADLMRGLEILSKYWPDDDRCWLRPEHDEIFVGDDETPVSTDDLLELEKLGFELEAGIGWRASL